MSSVSYAMRHHSCDCDVHTGGGAKSAIMCDRCESAEC